MALNLLRAVKPQGKAGYVLSTNGDFPEGEGRGDA